jgi:ankyrin repeat protein
MMQPLPFTAPPEKYREQSAALLQAALRGDVKALQFLHGYNLRLQKLSEEDFDKHTFIQQDADEAILNWYHFKDWNDLENFVKAVKEQPAVTQFERAVDAIITGDLETLKLLLQKNPALIKARSVRWHGSMLLHYVGANGVEDFRQQTPSNAVEILEYLLEAGADVNAEAGMYGGGSTTFGLAATSIWPAKAGVLVPMLETLLRAGANIGGEGSVRACLANGRPEAAAALVRFGAQLDLEEAAGVGSMDVVKTYFTDDGKLKDASLRQKMEAGMMWACEFGQFEVVKFFLDAGLDPDLQVDGMAGIHWAVLGAHQEVVALLIERGASMENMNKYGGAALESTLWAVIHSDPVYRWPDNKADYPVIIDMILKAGAIIKPGVLEWVMNTEEIPYEKKQPIVLLLHQYSAT